MFLGFMLILNPLVVVADVVPFIGSNPVGGGGNRFAAAHGDRRPGGDRGGVVLVSAAGLGGRAGDRSRARLRLQALGVAAGSGPQATAGRRVREWRSHYFFRFGFGASMVS
jgi:hypothetical protein